MDALNPLQSYHEDHEVHEAIDHHFLDLHALHRLHGEKHTG
jgi:hypothetical protein